MPSQLRDESLIRHLRLFQSAQDIGGCLGISHHTVEREVRRWREGWLQGEAPVQLRFARDLPGYPISLSEVAEKLRMTHGLQEVRLAPVGVLDGTAGAGLEDDEKRAAALTMVGQAAAQLLEERLEQAQGAPRIIGLGAGNAVLATVLAVRLQTLNENVTLIGMDCLTAGLALQATSAGIVALLAASLRQAMPGDKQPAVHEISHTVSAVSAPPDPFQEARSKVQADDGVMEAR